MANVSELLAVFAAVFAIPSARRAPHRNDARVVQRKDAQAIPPFQLIVESEGPRHASTFVRLLAQDDDRVTSTTSAVDDQIIQFVTTLVPEPAITGKPGISVRAVMDASGNMSYSTVQRGMRRLCQAGKLLVTGTGDQHKTLYMVKNQ